MVSSIIENKPDNPKIVPPIWDYPAYFLELDASDTPSFSSKFFYFIIGKNFRTVVFGL